MMYLGILAGIAALLVLLVSTVLVYFLIRKKWPHRRIANEVAVIAFAFVLAFGVRLTVAIMCGLPNGQDNLDTGIALVLYVLYSTIGGLSFEGVDGLLDLSLNGIMQSLYYGILVYAGLVTLMILSVGLSYEWYSYLAMRGRHLSKRYTNFYIFTDVTEEGLLLAKSIKQQQQENKRKNDSVIIFTGGRLEPFDRKNQLHREIMCNGFLYWSYKTTESTKQKSIIKRLHFAQSYNLEDLYKRNICIFAIKNDSKLQGAEDSNSDVVFNDIDNVLNDYQLVWNEKYQKPYGIPLVIKYYMLTNKDVNYEFYKTRQDELINRHIKEKYGKDSKISSDVDRVGQYFQVNVLNEAVMSGYNLVEQLKAKIFKQYSIDEWEEYKSFLQPNSNGVFRVGVFGFGSNSEQAMKQLYMHSMQLVERTVDDKTLTCPVRFIADIYDKSMDELSGKFSYSHPLFVCVAGNNNLQTDIEILEYEKEHPTEAFNDICKVAQDRGISRDEVRREMALPIVVLHNQSCLAKDFMHSMDSSFAGIYDRKAVDYRAFVIGLGADELNITMANLLIDDFKHEITKAHNTSSNSQPVKQTKTNGPKIIFVNIRNEKNIKRLNWSQLEKEKFEHELLVIPFGCRTNIWSCSSLDDRLDSIYNYGYETVRNAFAKKEKWGNANSDLVVDCLTKYGRQFDIIEVKKQKQLYGHTDKDIVVTLVDVPNATNGGMKKVEVDLSFIAEHNSSLFELDLQDLDKCKGKMPSTICRYLWEKVDCYNKQSNKSARMYAHNFYFSREMNPRQLIELEHHRWCCFTIAQGWVYSCYNPNDKPVKNFRRHIKEHNCLCPLVMVDRATVGYDECNTILGRYDQIVKMPISTIQPSK